MKPKERVETGQTDMFRARLDQFIDMTHPLVRLRQETDWGYMNETFGAVYKDGAGHPPLPTQLMVGLAIIKHMENLSDEDLTERWVRDPYYQYLCGEEFFQHKAPFDRSSLTRWRKRMGEERLSTLILEALRIAHKTKALGTQDLQRVVVDTTVQPKNIAHPTDHRLLLKSIEKLAKLAKKEGLELRQSYRRVAKLASIKAGRYIHAKQFKRARREIKFLRTRLGRVIRDIRRQLDKKPWLEDKFHALLMLASKVKAQDQHQRGQKVYALHAPEVECIGKGKARAPYEFGCKVSIVTPVTQPKGGQFVLHAEAHHGNPYDGHTLGPVLEHLENRLGLVLERGHVDKGYKGHNYRNKFKIWISGQAKRVTKQIKREMKRRAAVEPVIGHVKAEHRMGRNYLKYHAGDRTNAVLAAAGFNFHLLLRWFHALLLRLFFLSLRSA
jgi:IS5 family transposase